MDKKVLVAVSVASMIDQFNMPNIRLLKDMGYEVHVACNFKEGNTCDDRRIRKLQNKLDNLQVERHQWDCPRGILPAWKCVRAYRQLCDLCQKYLFAWIHCQSPIGGALSRMAAHRFKIRVLYTAHGFHFYRGAPFKNWLLYYPAEKWLSKWTDAIITVNKEDYQFAKSKFGVEKIFYIPGIGIETKKFQNVETSKIEHRRFCNKYHIPENARILLSVGELNKGKNHRRVIAALAGIRGTGAAKDVFYVICGQGKQYKALKKYANQLGVGSCVKMPGYQERMPCIYRNADIFLFPSKREGMPTALIEAMAAGLPCIVTDIRGNRELIDRHGGRLFPLKQEGQPGGYILELLENKELRDACGARNREMAALYDICMVEKRMKKIYQKMERKPMVSVLIALYNPNLVWLRHLLRSIARQTYQNFEVLLLDDASENVSFRDIQKAAAACIQSKYVSVSQNGHNEGSNKTFEKLAALAHGDYLAFCDQDDIWERDKIEKLLDALKREHAVMAYSDMSVIDEKGNVIYKSLRNMRKGLKFVHGSAATAYYLADNCSAGCSMLVQADVLKKAVPFSEKVYCDQWIAACVSAYGRIAFVRKPLVRYRRHEGNQTNCLWDIKSKQDYYEKRISPMCMLVEEMKDRDIHYKDESQMFAFAHARKNRNVFQIWKYRRFNRKYAYFDLLIICLPETLVRILIHICKKGRGNRM